MSAAKWIALGWNLVFLVGALIVVYGLSLAWRPLGFIVGGLLLALLGWGGGVEQVRKGSWRG